MNLPLIIFPSLPLYYLTLPTPYKEPLFITIFNNSLNNFNILLFCQELFSYNNIYILTLILFFLFIFSVPFNHEYFSSASSIIYSKNLFNYTCYYYSVIIILFIIFNVIFITLLYFYHPNNKIK